MRARLAADRLAAPPVKAQPETMSVPLLLQLCGWLTKAAGRCLWWLGRHPVVTLVLGAGVATWQASQVFGWASIPAIVGLVAVVLCGWHKRWPDGFRRLVIARVKGTVRAGLCYRLHWHSACESMALGRALDGQRYLPRLVKVRSLGAVDVVTARMLPGQTLDDWHERADAMAHMFNAVSCRMKARPKGPRGVIDLRFLAHDPFISPVEPFALRDEIDLDAVAVAMREEGYPFQVSIRGSHFLLIGETRSGKSSAMQYLVYALAPAIGAGLAQLHTIDMKGGVEFTHVEALSTSQAYKRPEDARELLKNVVTEILDPRLDRMREEGIRAHEPTIDEPLHVVAIDELAAITAYVQDGALKKEINSYLALILSKGLGAGVVVIAGVQDGRKAVVDLRGLFTHRIAFRLSEPDDVDMVLSRGARARGARCDEIPKSQRGVCYADVDGEREPARLRFPYVVTADIKATAARYATADGPSLNVIPLGQDETTDDARSHGDDTDAAA